MNWNDYLSYSPVLLAFLGGTFTWLFTSAGAAMIFFFRKVNVKVLNSMLGFAAGIMIAASFWSLLEPAIEISVKQGDIPWVVVSVGFLAGGAFLFMLDKIIPHLHLGFPDDKAEGIKTNWRRSILLVLAITLHNIPEGLSVGVAFGAMANTPDVHTLVGAVSLAIGIGIQDFPEGAAVSIPLRREGLSMWKGFWYGQLSGFVELISAIIGAYLVSIIVPILPYALSFAAGAMIYVVIEELIPEAQIGQDTDFSTLGAMIGFALMMILDIALG
jgi:ZIP family zinc transporter